MGRGMHNQRIWKPNKRYSIYMYYFKYGCVDYVLYFIKKNGLIHIYKHINNAISDNDFFTSDTDFSQDQQWIDEGFTDIKVLKKAPYINEEQKLVGEPICYVILKEPNGKGRIVELLSKKTILKDFSYSDYQDVTERTIYEGPFKDKDDSAIRFINYENKSFALYSLVEGYIFSPKNYTDICFYKYGTILDEELAVENNGFVLALSEYEQGEDPRIYFNKERDKYFMLLDEDYSMIHYMYSDDFHPEIVKVELPSVTYKYNKKTGELTQDYGLDDNPYDLTDYSDIAYEGYSRLYLGLED